MILPLFRRNRRADTIAALYGTIVAQARAPAFYLDYGVPDTVAGRLDMIILHAVLVLRVPAADSGACTCARFCRLPVDKLSNPATVCSSFSSVSSRLDPINPAAPVTSHRRGEAVSCFFSLS